MSFRRVVVFAAALAAGAAMAQDAPTQPATPASATGSAQAAPAASAPAGAASATVAAEMGPLSGDAKAGQAKAAVCGACHGLDGNSSMAQYPKLAGQNEHYIVEQLKHFKSGQRKNPIMMGMAAPLSVKDMHDIAAYFASQTVKPGVADEALVGPGGTLYREGDAKRGIPACMSCHGPDGRGNPGAPYPQLAGQHADYVQQVLTAWHGGDVWGPGKHAQIMPSIAKKLTKKDIAAVASYIEGLHTNPDAIVSK
ncbi:MAG TPA: c-type cytochrome [Rhodanobacteraceae bacterium]|nr:c-type cytochrome [Rhodanobacteraceae bacterium]